MYMSKYPLTGTGASLRLETLQVDSWQWCQTTQLHLVGSYSRRSLAPSSAQKETSVAPRRAMECGKRPVSWIQGGGGPFSSSFLGGRDRLIFSSLLSVRCLEWVRGQVTNTNVTKITICLLHWSGERVISWTNNAVATRPFIQKKLGEENSLCGNGLARS
jgi:hypothetical protein